MSVNLKAIPTKNAGIVTTINSTFVPNMNTPLVDEAKAAYEALFGARVGTIANQTLNIVSISEINKFKEFFANYAYVANIFDRGNWNYNALAAKTYANLASIPDNAYPEMQIFNMNASKHALFASGLIAYIGNKVEFTVPALSGTGTGTEIGTPPRNTALANGIFTVNFIWNNESTIANLEFNTVNTLIIPFATNKSAFEVNNNIIFKQNLPEFFSKVKDELVDYFITNIIDLAGEKVEYTVEVNFYNLINNIVTTGNKTEFNFIAGIVNYSANVQSNPTVDVNKNIIDGTISDIIGFLGQ